MKSMIKPPYYVPEYSGEPMINPPYYAPEYSEEPMINPPYYASEYSEEPMINPPYYALEYSVEPIITPPYYASVCSETYIYSIDRIKITMCMNECVRNHLRNNINLLKELIPRLNISQPDDRNYCYRYRCTKDYYDENGNKYARLEMKILQNLNEGDDCGYIVINPNKFFNSEECIRDLKALYELVDECYINSMDIAIDIPVDKQFVHLKKDKRTKMKFQVSKDNTTEYLGKKRNAIGHVKLYNKTIESKLSYDLTRLEITVGNPCSEKWLDSVIKCLPNVIISTPDNQGESLPENFNGTEKALIELLLKTPDKVDYWNKLGYKMKKKIKPYVFAGDKEFEYDLEAIQKVADNLMNTLKNIDNEKEE
ncbi:MAG TPA: hypothetical protein P5191_07920 [Ruminococcus sp.]|nr:hypothetical protein [Ruminococcus sp.]